MAVRVFFGDDSPVERQAGLFDLDAWQVPAREWARSQGLRVERWRADHAFMAAGTWYKVEWCEFSGRWNFTAEG